MRDVLADARKKGASACEAEVSEGFGQSVSVRCGEVETIEYNRDKGLGITIYQGQRKGHASTSDLSRKALQDTVDAALNIARFTAPDDCAGLAEAELLATEMMPLDLYYPWLDSVEQSIDLAKACEEAAFAVDPRISNSEGASISTQEAHFCMGNSLGFEGGYASSRHYISCSVIAGEQEAMQRDDWYTTARDPAQLADAASVGADAAKRALARLGSQRIKTGEVPVIFEAQLAASLIGNFVHAVSGGALYRKTTFLLDQMGKSVFSPSISIRERPHLSKGLASSPFDNDGVRTQDRDIVQAGVLQGYFLSTYTARKLGLRSTGNAGGCHNLIVEPGKDGFDALLRQMDRGLLVTELLGQGVNYVTGDYSRGAAGFWVENGRIVHPVEEITIAGNLKDMFRNIVAVGSDTLVRGSKQCGSLLLERMTVAGV